MEAFEIEPDLAERAARNLSDETNVTVHTRNASQGTLPSADVIYISAGASMPLDTWLDALRPGGRLLFPLTPADGPGTAPGVGAMLLVTRPQMPTPASTARDASATDPASSIAEIFSARFLSPAIFIPCVGARDEATGAKLAEAFKRGDARNVRSLRRRTPPDGTAWCAGDGWWLSSAPVP